MSWAVWGSAVQCSRSRRVPVWGCPPVSRLVRSRVRVSVVGGVPAGGGAAVGAGHGRGDAPEPADHGAVGVDGAASGAGEGAGVGGAGPVGGGCVEVQSVLGEELVPFGGGGVDVLGAGVPAQSLAGQVGEVGVEPLELGERRGPVSDHRHGCARARRWARRAARGGAASAGGRSTVNGAACHQLIVNDPTDTSLDTWGREPGPGSGGPGIGAGPGVGGLELLEVGAAGREVPGRGVGFIGGLRWRRRRH